MLFDLASDHREKNDRAGEQPERVNELKAKYDRWASQMVDPKWRYGSRGGNRGQKKKKRRADG